ncbi:MAG: hypothetical protein ACPGVB_01710 [Chitinophagales bacterium]
MSNYHIDDIFRESLRDFEVYPSPSIWENMEFPAPLPFYRKPAFITSSVIGVILLIGSILFNNSKIESSSNTGSNSLVNQVETIRNYSYSTIPTPFSPDYYLSQKVIASTSNNTIHTNQKEVVAQAHTDRLTARGSTSNDSANLESGIADKHLPNSNDNSSLYSDNSVLESEPVNTPFYFTFNLLETVSKNVSNFTPHFGYSPLIANVSLNPDESTTKSTTHNTGIDEIPSLSITNLDEPPIDINAADKDLFVSSERDAIMAQYNQQLSITRGFHLGTFASAHNNWILNPALKETVTQNSNLVHQLDFGYTYGVAMGYEFSNKWGLQMEWIVNSEQGQRFSKQALYNSTNKSNTDINLTYTYFPVLLKYRNQKMFSLTKQPLVINYIAGIQYGTLKSAEININNPVVQEDLLQLSSWGFVWGLDYDFYLNKNYFLTFGARTSLSTSSDSKYKPVFPTPNTSNSLLIGLRASFNYQFD